MSNFKAFTKKYPTTSIVVAIVLILIAWWAWVSFSPKPLGDGLEYLGKKDFGNIFGFDSKPYSDYYYGTDMDEKELEHYFKGASLKSNTPTSPSEMRMTLAFQNEEFVLYYNQDHTSAPFISNKKNMVVISSFHYTLARKSLDQ